jgi:hypothetical protein
LWANQEIRINMTKNMTRKGLAIGAGASLFAASFVGLPSQAVGIQNDNVVLADTQAYGNYNMLTTGYIDISASFSGAAQSGSNLKLYVNDPSNISIYDTVRQGATDAASTPTVAAIAEIEVAASTADDKIVVAFATASGLQAGDVVDGASVTATNSDAAVLTFLNANTDQTVTSTKAIAAGNMTKFSSTAADPTVVTITKADHGIVAGDIIKISGSNVDSVTTDADADYNTAFNTYHLVTAADSTTFVFSVASSGSSGTTAQTDVNFLAGTVAVENVTFTADATVDTAVTGTQAGNVTTGAGGTFADLTQSDALSDVTQMRALGFGYNAMLGVASTLTKSSAASTLYDYVVDTNNTDRTNGDKVVRFTPSSKTADGVLTVTAWIDDDGDDLIDSTEYASDSLTINFVEPATAAFTIAQENVFIGVDAADPVLVTAVVAGDYNLKEIGLQTLLRVQIDHILANGTVEAESTPDLTYDGTDENLQGNDADLTTALAAGSSVRFAVQDKENTNATIGAVSTFGVGALTIAGSTLSVPSTVNNTGAFNQDSNGEAMGSQAVKVRTKTASVVGTITAWDGDPTNTAVDKLVPNVPYTMTITSTNVTAADGVKFNGKVVDGGTAEVITGRTSATGTIALNLTQTAADAADVVTVEVDVQGKDKTALMAFTYEAPTLDVSDAAGELTGTTEYDTTMVIGGTLTNTYVVADQFGVAPANGTAVVTATRSGTRTTTQATWGYQVPVVGGVATVTISDDGVGSGSDTVSIKVIPLLPGGALGAADATNTYTLTYAATAANVTPGSVTAVVNFDGIDDVATDELPVRLEPDTLVNHDARASNGVAAPAYDVHNVDSNADTTADAGLTLSGTVSNANGGVIAGALVTITGTGVGFKTTTAGTSLDIFTVGSITVRTGAAGTYSVEVYGGTGGLKTLSVTAGAATASDEVTFAAGGAVSGFTLTTPGASEPGKTVDVFVNLTDAFGNPVAGATVTLSSTGPGYLINTTGTTLATGVYNTKLLVGVNDSGTAVITATVTIDGVATTKLSSIVIGVGAVAASEQKVNVGSFKGYVALYAKGYKGQEMSAIVAGKWITVASLASNFERVVRYTGAGYTITTKIYIDGVQVGDAFTTVTK